MVTDNHIGEIRTRVAKVWLREDGIVQIVILPGTEFTLLDAKQGLASIVQVSNGKRRPLLADGKNVRSMSFASRQEAATYEEATSLAILTDSPVSRYIGTVFMTLNKKAYPVRLFTSEAEAIEWLKGFLE